MDPAAPVPPSPDIDPDSVDIDADSVSAALASLRSNAPLVQCLTNSVATGWTANVLLAVGASPAMVDNPDEAGDFASAAGAVLVNLGTPTRETVAGMRTAVSGCAKAGTPWVLDPVAAGALRWRTEIATELLNAHPPAVIRGNASEIAGLAGGAGGRGVDSTSTPDQVLDVARALADQHNCVVAVSGATDHLIGGGRLVTISNGHPWMTQVTGMGCALGALMAAFTATVHDPLRAAAAATATLTVAADLAAHNASGPGSFAVGVLDALAGLSPTQLGQMAQVRQR